MTSSWIVTNLEIFAKMREAAVEATFLDVYGSPVLQAAVGVKAERQESERVSHNANAETRRAELVADMTRGGFLEASLRALLYVLRGGGADERQFNALEAFRSAAPENERVPLSQAKAIIRRQAALLRFDEEQAIVAIPQILPDDHGRRARALSAIRDLISADGDPDPSEEKRFQRVSRLFEGAAAKVKSLSQDA